MKLVFLRHADPDYAHDSLTPLGEKESQALASFLQSKRIDYVYCSPLGRARETCRAYLRAAGRADVVVLEWLQEFRGLARKTLLPGASCAWNLSPDDYEEDEKLYSALTWQEAELWKKGPGEDTPKLAQEAFGGLDALLAEHGYPREGLHYAAERPNEDVLAFFCHYGILTYLIAHLTNLSPTLLAQATSALPASVTVLYSEERDPGKASWRIQTYGSIAHLEAEGIVSTSGNGPEVAEEGKEAAAW